MTTSSDVPESMKHPARYSKPILELFKLIVEDFRAKDPLARIDVLDPFAGTGRIHTLHDQPRVYTFGIEIEPEWAAMNERTSLGNALALPYGPARFDMVITSPAYGNRLADKHDARDGSIRRSYTHDLRRLTGDDTRTLNEDNTGGVAFGPKYQELHARAWREVWRVLKPNGWFVLNVSDFVKNKVTVPVAGWHLDHCLEMGFELLTNEQVDTRRLRYGRNHESRVSSERVFVFRKPERP